MFQRLSLPSAQPVFAGPLLSKIVHHDEPPSGDSDLMISTIFNMFFRWIEDCHDNVGQYGSKMPVQSTWKTQGSSLQKLHCNLRISSLDSLFFFGHWSPGNELRNPLLQHNVCIQQRSICYDLLCFWSESPQQIHSNSWPLHLQSVLQESAVSTHSEEEGCEERLLVLEICALKNAAMNFLS